MLINYCSQYTRNSVHRLIFFCKLTAWKWNEVTQVQNNRIIIHKKIAYNILFEMIKMFFMDEKT